MEDYKPKMPEGVRTWAYLITAIVGVTAILVTDISPIFSWLPEEQAEELAGAVTKYTSAIGGILGVAYRPTRGKDKTNLYDHGGDDPSDTSA